MALNKRHHNGRRIIDIGVVETPKIKQQSESVTHSYVLTEMCDDIT